MNFEEILNYELLNTGNFQLNVSKLAIAIFVILVTLFVLRMIRRVIRKRVKKGSLDAGVYWTIFQVIRYLTWVIVIVLLLDTFGVKVSVLLASFAALLVGVGLGIQQVFGDLVSGLIILIERNLKMEDVIQLEDGTVGRVVEIGFRTSKIKTRDDIIMVIPNTKFVNDRIINWSHIDNKTRFHVSVGVAYGSDVELVTKVLLNVAKENEKVAGFPEPFVRFVDFGNSSLDFQLFFWVPESFLAEHIKSQLRYTIDAEFRKNNIQIPFPQRDLHFKTVSGAWEESMAKGK